MGCGKLQPVGESSKESSRVLTRQRFLLVNGVLLLLLLLSLAAAAAMGPGGIELGSVFPLDPDTNPAAAKFLLLRLPRALLAALVGMALSAVGVAFQALLRNPLADPFIMGVSGGAALGGTLAMAIAGSTIGAGWALQGPAAFLGAAVATVLVYRIGRVGGQVDPTTILLVGVVFNAFASAVIMFLKTVVGSTKMREMLFWLMGTLGEQSYLTLALLAGAVVCGVSILWVLASAMNALSLGEQGAGHLGVDVERAKRWVFFAASLLTGLAVSVSGLIGFVGLIVPHLCRLVLGPDHRLLVPASALAGASFLVLADLAARLLFVPLTTTPPVGVVTAFLGGPFFLLLLRHRHRVAFIG